MKKIGAFVFSLVFLAVAASELQFYSGNFLDGTIANCDGKAIQQHNARCLETQQFPDSPNKPSFTSAILERGQKYHSVTKFKLSDQYRYTLTNNKPFIA